MQSGTVSSWGFCCMSAAVLTGVSRAAATPWTFDRQTMISWMCYAVQEQVAATAEELNELRTRIGDAETNSQRLQRIEDKRVGE